MSTQGTTDAGLEASSSPREYDEMTFTGVLDYAKTLFGLPAQMQALQAMQAAQQETVNSLLAQVQELREELCNARDTIREKNDRIATLEAQAEDTTQEITEVRQELHAVRNERDNAEHTVSTLRGVLIERDNVVAKANETIGHLEQEVSETRVALEARNRDRDYWRSRFDSEETSRIDLGNTLRQREDEINRLLQRLIDADAREQQLTKALSDIHSKVNELHQGFVTANKIVEHQPRALEHNPQPEDGQVDVVQTYTDWPSVA